MANMGTVLKSEIARLSRREIKGQVEPLRKASASFRKDIAALKRQVQTLERQIRILAKRAPKPEPEREDAEGRPLRFVAKGLVSLRARLGLSAPEMSRLMGVSSQSIYNWEQKKSVPRKEQISGLAALRGLGKREVRKRLEDLPQPKPAKKAR